LLLVLCQSTAFSALTLLVGRQEGQAACKKTDWWGTGVVICLERGPYLHIAQLMLLPLTVCCFSKIQIGFSFLVPAHLGTPGKRAIKRFCVCGPNYKCIFTCVDMIGSSKGEVSREECIQKIAASINYVHSQTANVITGSSLTHQLLYAFTQQLALISWQ